MNKILFMFVLKIVGVYYIVFCCWDVEEICKFYEDVLGMKFVVVFVFDKDLVG